MAAPAISQIRAGSKALRFINKLINENAQNHSILCYPFTWGRLHNRKPPQNSSPSLPRSRGRAQQRISRVSLIFFQKPFGTQCFLSFTLAAPACSQIPAGSKALRFINKSIKENAPNSSILRYSFTWGVFTIVHPPRIVALATRAPF